MLVDSDVHVGYETPLDLLRCSVHPRLRVRRYAVRTEGDELVVSLSSTA